MSVYLTREIVRNLLGLSQEEFHDEISRGNMARRSTVLDIANRLVANQKQIWSMELWPNGANQVLLKRIADRVQRLLK